MANATSKATARFPESLTTAFTVIWLYDIYFIIALNTDSCLISLRFPNDVEQRFEEGITVGSGDQAGR
jgi:hypothetical protein